MFEERAGRGGQDSHCHLSVERVAEACGGYFDACLEFLARRATAPSSVGQRCAAVFLGPDM